MLTRIRQQFEEARQKKRLKFDDLDPIVRRCLKEFSYLFPVRQINPKGSRVVYHFNAGDLQPISLEREHGSREYIPRHYANLALSGIDDLLTYIEANQRTEEVTGEEELKGDENAEQPNQSGEEEP